MWRVRVYCRGRTGQEMWQLRNVSQGLGRIALECLPQPMPLNLLTRDSCSSMLTSVISSKRMPSAQTSSCDIEC
jgi:hypothetical protein